MTFPTTGQTSYGAVVKAYIDEGVTAVSLGSSTGADDTTAINALLSANAGGHVKGKPGQNYQISAPLVLKSGTTLDMTGCTVTLKPGSNKALVRNYSWLNPAAAAADAAITAGNNVVTTALGASAVVGQSVTVAGAGASVAGSPPASGVLTGIVSAQTSTTITLVNLAGEPLNAGITVSAAAISLFNRDTGIRLIGGTWARGTNGGSGQDVHGIAFRGVDGVRVDIEGFTSTSGAKYAVRLSDVRDGWVRARGLNTSSDGVHFNGPLLNCRVEEVTGYTGDDLFAITSNDYTSDSDTSGEVRGVTIGTVRSENGGTHTCLMATGPGGIISDVKVLGAFLGYSASGIQIGGTSSTDVGTYGNIDLGTIRPSNSQTVAPLTIGTGNFDTLTAKVNHAPTSGSTRPAVTVGYSTGNTVIRVLSLGLILSADAPTGFTTANSTVTIDEVILNRPVAIGQTASGATVANVTSATIHRLVVKEANYQPVTSTSAMIKVGCTVDEVLIDDPYCVVPSGGHVVWLVSGGSNKLTTFRAGTYTYSNVGGNLYRVDGGTVGRAVFEGGYVTKSAALYADNIGVTGGGNVVIKGTTQNGSSRTCVFQTGNASVVDVSGLSVASMVNPLFHANATTMTVSGRRINGISTALVSRAAGTEVIKVKGADLPVDVALLTPDDGDMCINNNAASGPLAAIPVIYDGAASTWRGTKGYVVTGTATLVAGTVTVSDTKVTANSVIRLYVQTPGGTVGAPFISTITASTSFVIKSTSAADTSVVRYEIVRY